MSFFKTKTIVIKVRDISLTFNMISKKDFSEMQYYGKVTQRDLEENPEIVSLASDEITKILARKIIQKDDEPVPTADDLNELTNDELTDLVQKVSGSSESIKQSLNNRR